MYKKITHKEGLKLIREYGLVNFPSCAFDFYKVEHGVIAVRPCFFGGNELHVAFDKKGYAAKVSREFCESLGGKWWALIEDEYKLAINAAKKAGFIYRDKKQGRRLDGSITTVYILEKTS